MLRMSSIEKLLIRGIRSFDPQSQNVIEFYTPLTIIVGQNGAGKTTIIECLKFATTGELPPNSKGGAFIFDPKLAQETEVKAQVRLKFKNMNGQTMIVTRSLQLSQKKTKTEMKTLESLLVTKDPVTGQQVSLSSRCAEVDKEIPNSLGVSQAILENVIFCHQEDSNWPLSEPGTLKKKFDDIFAATKYTKALDELKGIRKDRAGELKLDAQKLEFMKVDLEKAKRIKLQVDVLQEKIEDGQHKVLHFEDEMALLSASINDYLERIAAADKQNLFLQQKRHEESTLLSSIRDLEQNMTLLEDDESALMARLSEHKNTLAMAQASLTEIEAKRGQIAQELEGEKNRQNSLLMERGLLMAKASAYEADLEKLQDAIKESGSSSTDIHEYKVFIEEQLKNAQDALSRESNTLAEEDKRLGGMLQTLLSEKATIEEKTRQGKQRLSEISKRSLEVGDKLTIAGNPSAEIDTLQAHLSMEQESLVDLQNMVSKASYEEKISEKKRKCQEIEQEIALLTDQLSKETKLSDARAKHSLKVGERSRKASSAESAFKALNELFEREGIPLLSAVDSDAERIIDRHLKMQEASISANGKSLQEAEGKLSSTIAKLNLFKAEQKKLEEEHKALQEKSARMTELSLLEYIASLESTLSEMSVGVSGAALYRQFYEQITSAKDCCPLCEQNINTDVLDSLSVKLQRLMSFDEGSLSKIKSQLSEAKKINEKIIELENVKLPHIKTSIIELEQVITVEESERDNILKTQSALKAKESTLTSLKKKAEDLSRGVREWKQLEAEVAFMEQEYGSSLSTLDSSYGSSSSEKLESLSSSLAVLRADIDKLQQDFQSKKRENQVKELKLRDYQEKLRISEESLKKKKELEGLLDDLSTESLLLQESIKENQGNTMAKIIDQEKDIISKRESAHSEFLTKQTRLQGEIEGLKHKISSFEHIYESMKSNSSALEALPRVKEALQRVEFLIEEHSVKLQNLLHELGSSSQKLAEIQVLERNIRDNQKHRELLKQKQNLQDLIGNIKNNMVSEEEKSQWNIALESLKASQEAQLRGRAGLQGELRQMQDQKERFLRELSSDYDSVDQKYTGEYVKCKTTELLLSDLDVYMKALDSAIMRYHSLKMAEINKIIRELWTNTYQGTDIDTIEIRSDAVAEGRGPRSYNYRVVMLKGCSTGSASSSDSHSTSVELDMRGRSSAGQRVLTSIIIRLALAEAFGVHCGILALDEPTTNLDRPNIESLAASLSSIIKTRRAQRNFQLIVITHDEDFVNLLGKSEFADYYWRISRDENQHSLIERQSI